MFPHRRRWYRYMKINAGSCWRHWRIGGQRRHLSQIWNMNFVEDVVADILTGFLLRWHSVVEFFGPVKVEVALFLWSELYNNVVDSGHWPSSRPLYLIYWLDYRFRWCLIHLAAGEMVIISESRANVAELMQLGGGATRNQVETQLGQVKRRGKKMTWKSGTGQNDGVASLSIALSRASRASRASLEKVIRNWLSSLG